MTLGVGKELELTLCSDNNGALLAMDYVVNNAMLSKNVLGSFIEKK